MNYILALLHGFFSILAPCIITMIPLYTVYLNEKKIAYKSLIFTAIGIVSAIVSFGIIFKTSLAVASIFMYFRHLIIIFIVIFILMQLKIINLPKVSINIKPQYHFFTGIIIATTWIPCISYFYIPIILISANITFLDSIILFTIYAVGILVPITLLTLIENQLLKKIQHFSFHHQQKIKYFMFIVLLITLIYIYFSYSIDCLECLNPVK